LVLTPSPARLIGWALARKMESMPDGNGNYDWRERMRRLEESIAQNWEDHTRIRQSIEALRITVETLRDSNIRLHEDVQNLVNGIRSLIDRIPPEALR
jgi:predicted  nucleic acid-binding Zn-ribbon protein